MKFLLFSLILASSELKAEEFFLKKFMAKEGEPSPSQIHDVLEDQRGLIYVADESGVLEYDGIQWRKIGLPGDGAAQSLTTDQNGRVYVAGIGDIGYLTPDSNGRMEFKSLNSSLKPEQKAALTGYVQLQSMGLSVAFVTDRKVFVWANNVFNEYESPGDIHTSLGLTDQLLIVDSKEGLLSLNSQGLSEVPNGEFFSASALHLDKSGRILGGSMSDGLIELKLDPAARFRSFPKQDKAATMGATITRVRTLDDKILLATIGKGLSMFSGETGQSIPLADKLKKDLGPDIVALATDSHNRIWVGTLQGMYVLTDKSTAGVKSEQQKEKTPSFFAYVRSCVSMKDQEVIFGGAFFQELGGVQTLEASSLNRPELPFTQNALRFGYASSDLVNADAVEYQTFLIGYDKDWTEWSGRTYREFTNLVWKKYVFQVKARLPDGTVSPVATFELKILPPWYERYWFYLVQLAVLLVLVLFITYLKGWTNRASTTEKLNGVVVGTIWGYSFSKVGVQGVIWAMSGGAAFLAIITNAFMGIFLKPMQKKLEGKIIHLEDQLIKRYKNRGAPQTGNVDKAISWLKQKPRFKPGPKAYPPKHLLRAASTPKRQVTRLVKSSKGKGSSTWQKSA